jgi:hypothetical protein
VSTNILVVFDLDGTICDDTHRRHHLKKPDFPAYNIACVDDLPKIATLAILGALVTSGRRCEIWSGRDNAQLRATANWFVRHAPWVVAAEIEIKLRPDGDYRSSAALKEAWLDAVIAEGGSVLMAFDDLQVAVDMWRRRGVPCFQVEANNNEARHPAE